MTQDIIQIHAEELGARSTQIDYSRINNQSLENLTASTYSNLLALMDIKIKILALFDIPEDQYTTMTIELARLLRQINRQHAIFDAYGKDQ